MYYRDDKLVTRDTHNYNDFRFFVKKKYPLCVYLFYFMFLSKLKCIMVKNCLYL